MYSVMPVHARCFEDVDVDHPDKKSIMMYVMCLFQVLPHDNIAMDERSAPPAASKHHRAPAKLLSQVSTVRNLPELSYY